MKPEQLTEAQAEAHVKDLYEQAKVSAGSIQLTLAWTPEGNSLDVTMLDKDGRALSAEEGNAIELNPFLPSHVLVWALRFRFQEMHQGATQMLQIDMQEQALARKQTRPEPIPGSPEAIAEAMERIKDAAR